MELNLLELEFLTRVGWRIVPRGEVLGEYYRSLVGRMSERYGVDERAVGGREFVGEIAGQLMAGEILPIAHSGGSSEGASGVSPAASQSSTEQEDLRPDNSPGSELIGATVAEAQGGEGRQNGLR